MKLPQGSPKRYIDFILNLGWPDAIYSNAKNLTQRIALLYFAGTLNEVNLIGSLFRFGFVFESELFAQTLRRKFYMIKT